MTITKSDLEEILSLAPGPKPPIGLREQLRAEAPKTAARVLPQPTGNLSVSNWLRRWWPALAPALASAACAVVLGVQQSELNDLKRSLQTPATYPADQQNDSSGASDSVSSAANFPDTEQAEIERLEALATQLRSEIAQLEQLRVENEKLRLLLASPAVSGLSKEDIESAEKLSQNALSIQCINNLKQFGLAVRIWANDRSETQPPNILTMSNELVSPKILVCPADRARKVASDWSGFTSANFSYEYFVAADNNLTEPTRVLSRCPIHGHIGLCDGSVHKELAKIHPDWLTQRNGLMYLERATVTTNILTR